MARPTWDEYFLELMHAASKRATCDRGRCASIIIRDNHVLATGYVGSPRGMEHCDQIGHLMMDVLAEDGTKRQHCVRTVHAEQNAIVQAAREGVAIKGGTIYVSMEPCFTCAKMIVNAGIKRVVCEKRYHAAQLTRELFKLAEVQLDVLNDEEMEYE